MSVRIIPFDYQEIGREIRARRNKLGMTQRQLAAKIRVSKMVRNPAWKCLSALRTFWI